VKKNNFRRRYQHDSPGEPQRRWVGTDVILLRVATDPTTVTSHADEGGERSYDFISVEEAEDALRRERARYEGERSELEFLLEVQREQLKDLANGRREKGRTGGKNYSGTARNGVLHGRNGDGGHSPTRIVIRGSHARANVHVDEMNSNKKSRPKSTRNSFRNNANENDDSLLRMEELEDLLQGAIIENEKLSRRLRDQRHQYNVERTVHEDELREERGRLNCVRDELHMERAYFETSRRMLERMLEDEQRKVQELEQELLMIISQEQVFPPEDQAPEDYQQHQQQAPKNQSNSQFNNGNGQQENRGRRRTRADFTMNINDVQCPLYP